MKIDNEKMRREIEKVENENNFIVFFSAVDKLMEDLD